MEERLEALLAERRQAEEELADAAGAREQALQELYRLRSAAERLELRRESARRACSGSATSSRGRGACSTTGCAPSVPASRTEVRLLEERLRTLDRALAEQEGLPPAARALAEDGERIALSLLDVEPGRSVRLPRRSAARPPPSSATMQPALSRCSSGRGTQVSAALVVLVGRDPAQLVAGCRSSRRRSCSPRRSRP